MDYLKIANSPGMWIACIIPLVLLWFQALKFMSMAFKTGKKMGMERETLISGLRAGLISSIGPSCAILIGMMALIVNMGGPFSWMRLSYIGSIMYELMAANFGAMAVGTKLGAPEFGKLAFSNAVWVQTIGALGWLVVCLFLTHKLELVRTKIAGGKIEFLPTLTAAAMLGAFAYMCAPNLLAGNGSAISLIIGMLSMIFFIKFSDKLHIKWIKEWSLGFAMLIGMFAGTIF